MVINRGIYKREFNGEFDCMDKNGTLILWAEVFEVIDYFDSESSENINVMNVSNNIIGSSQSVNRHIYQNSSNIHFSLNQA